MENYIVRIYRRGNNNPETILGTIEKPDSGKKKTFKSFEELYSIIVPSENISPTKQKQIVEHRKFRRFIIKGGTLTFDLTTDVGEMTNISMGGLSFKSSNIEDAISPPVEVSILFGEGKSYTENILCNNIISHNTPSDSAFNDQVKRRRFSVEFADPTPAQKKQLEFIIQNYTLDEA